MQAADFLQDHQTMAAVMDRCGAAVVGPDLDAAPTDIEHAAARKVLHHVTMPHAWARAAMP